MVEEKWTLGEGTFQGRLLILRVRTELRPVPDASRGTRLTVRWEYGDTGPEGLPPSEVLQDLDPFEDRLFAALERDGVATAVVVATTAGAREWILYTSSGPTCEERINATFGGDGRRYPIQLILATDPGWLEYLGILDSLGLQKPN